MIAGTVHGAAMRPRITAKPQVRRSRDRSRRSRSRAFTHVPPSIQGVRGRRGLSAAGPGATREPLGTTEPGVCRDRPIGVRDSRRSARGRARQGASGRTARLQAVASRLFVGAPSGVAVPAAGSCPRRSPLTSPRTDRSAASWWSYTAGGRREPPRRAVGHTSAATIKVPALPQLDHARSADHAAARPGLGPPPLHHRSEGRPGWRHQTPTTGIRCRGALDVRDGGLLAGRALAVVQVIVIYRTQRRGKSHSRARLSCCRAGEAADGLSTTRPAMVSIMCV
jgi:hypothetical protein